MRMIKRKITRKGTIQIKRNTIRKRKTTRHTTYKDKRHCVPACFQSEKENEENEKREQTNEREQERRTLH